MKAVGLIGLMVFMVFIGFGGLMGCSAEGPDLSQQVPQAVSFSSYTEQFQSTRGGEIHNFIPDGGSIGVYAYLHDNSTWNDAATPNFMWNQQVTYHSEADIFDYAPLKYWPNEEDDKVSFIAYYPYSNGAADDGTTYDVESTGVTPLLNNDGNGLPSFQFTVKDEAAEQVDLLVSDLVADLPQSRDTENDPGTPFHDLSIYDRVKFMFRHALCKVEFRIVADADIRKDIAHFRIEENGLNITNIAKDGTLTTSYDGTNTSFTWGSHSALHGTGETDPTYQLPFKTYTPQLLMPQDLGDEVKLNLSYEITFKSDGTSYHYYGSQPGEGDVISSTLVADKDYTYSNTATLKLNGMKEVGTGDPLNKWLANHHYIYTIRLRANRIEFTGEVVEWGDTGNIEGIEVME